MGQEKPGAGASKRTENLDAIAEGISSIEATSLASKMGRLMPSIEARLAEGVQHQAVVAFLNESGIQINLGTFRSYLARARKKGKEVQRVTGESAPHAVAGKIEAAATSPALPPPADRDITTPSAGAASPVVGNKAQLARLRQHEVNLEDFAKVAKGKK